ncbi:hypothetical protein TrCOL_g9166 [Triparma columacea]|uniref:Uncharacterized protein n=1 Tax=Triparma columacea TaxID=722753 RepID=A0A9W7L604_9STRA|nr:hypothetical protein TrCOL_g9166 [Triparma columacea]
MMNFFDVSLEFSKDGSSRIAVAVHPGVVGTGIWRGLPNWVNMFTERFMISKDEGAKHIENAMFNSGYENGKYYSEGVETKYNEIVEEVGRRKELREWAEIIVKEGKEREEREGRGECGEEMGHTGH